MQPFSDPRTLPWRERQRRRLVRASLAALRPPPNVTNSEWADRHRELTSSQSALAGRWRTSETPYLREPLDSLSPNSPVQVVIFQKGSRVGYTEGIINNTIGAFMHMAPCPILVAQPSESDAEEWSKDSLDPMLSSTPVLAGLVTPDGEKKKGNTILHKRYRGGVITAVSAATGKSFRRRLARLLLGDELDAWAGSIDGEGDPWLLFLRRADTFVHSKKVVGGSTPTVKGHSRVERLFLDSDQRYYHVPCPSCGHYQQLVWGQFSWRDGDSKTTVYVCARCEAQIQNHQKRAMLERGVWVPTYPERDVRGYHLASWYSPWVPWSQFVSEWMTAQGDPTLEQVWTNTVAGETWDLANAEKWSQEELRALRAPLVEVPARAACVTAAVDVQGDRLVLVVDAWGPNEERWTLFRRDLLGDPTGPEVWDELDAALLERYPLEGGGSVKIRACCIDAGFQTQAVKAFCKTRKKRRVWPIKGQSGPGVPVWPREGKIRNKGRTDVRTVGVDAAKEALHARLRRSAQMVAAADKAGGSRGAMLALERGGPGFWHFSGALNESFFEELTAEVQVVRHSAAKRGGTKAAARREWILRESGTRNEALDCCVYSYAALQSLVQTGAVKLDKPIVSRGEPPTSTFGSGPVKKATPPMTPNLESRDGVSISPPTPPATPTPAPTHIAPPTPVATAPPPKPPKAKRPRFF